MRIGKEKIRNAEWDKKKIADWGIKTVASSQLFIFCP
jgi:hypothetical protein